MDVIPETIEEEVRGGVLAPNSQLIPVVLALANAHPGGVLHDIRDAHMRLFAQLPPIHNGDGLGHVQQHRRRLDPLRQRLTEIRASHDDGFEGGRILLGKTAGAHHG